MGIKDYLKYSIYLSNINALVSARFKPLQGLFVCQSIGGDDMANDDVEQKKKRENAFKDYLRGYTLQEIADRNDTCLNSVKSWHHRYDWKDRKESCFNKDGSINEYMLEKYTDGDVVPIYDSNNPESYVYGSPHDLRLATAIRNSLHNAIQYLNTSKPTSDDEVKNRVISYFKVCLDNEIIPTMEGVWLCLGITRAVFDSWKGGKLGTVRADFLERTALCVHETTTQLALGGKIPASLYTFISKNYQGMKDQTDSVITHHKDNSDTATPEEIAERLNNVPQEDSKPIIDVDFDEVDT